MFPHPFNCTCLPKIAVWMLDKCLVPHWTGFIIPSTQYVKQMVWGVFILSLINDWFNSFLIQQGKLEFRLYDIHKWCINAIHDSFLHAFYIPIHHFKHRRAWKLHSLPRGVPQVSPKGRAAVNQADALPWELASSFRAAPQSSEHRSEAKVWFSKESGQVMHPSRIPIRALPKFPAQVLRSSCPGAVTHRCRQPMTYKPCQTRRLEIPCNSRDSCLVHYFTFHIGSGWRVCVANDLNLHRAFSSLLLPS